MKNAILFTHKSARLIPSSEYVKQAYIIIRYINAENILNGILCPRNPGRAYELVIVLGSGSGSGSICFISSCLSSIVL